MQVSKDRGSRKVLELAKMWKKLPPETKQVRGCQLGYSIKMACFYEAIVTYARPIITEKKMQQKIGYPVMVTGRYRSSVCFSVTPPIPENL